MSSRDSIYVSNAADVNEMERAVRLCLRADWDSVPETVVPQSWAAWLKQGHWKGLAAHVVEVYRLAESRALLEISQADRLLRHGLRSTYAEMEELPQTNDPLRRNLLRSSHEEKIPGHLATFCAVSARQHFLPLLVALQSAFFLEWRARQVRLSDATVAQFAAAVPDFINQLRSFLLTHETREKPRFGVL